MTEKKPTTATLIGDIGVKDKVGCSFALQLSASGILTIRTMANFIKQGYFIEETPVWHEEQLTEGIDLGHLVKTADARVSGSRFVRDANDQLTLFLIMKTDINADGGRR